MIDRGKSGIYALAGLLSIALSLWCISNNTLINNDGVFYLQAIQGDPQSIKTIGHWLFYSYLIEGVHWLSGLNPENSAQLLDLLLDLLLVLAFIRLVEALGGRRSTLIWAAVVVLSLPYLNDNRAEIIRDHGYWAFTLVGLIGFLQLLQEFRWRHVAGWQLSMILATLFRVEGFVFLLLLPLSLLFCTQWPLRQRLLLLSKTLSPTLLIAAILLLWIFTADAPDNRLTEALKHGWRVVGAYSAQIPEKVELLRQKVVPEFSSHTSTAMIYFGILYGIVDDLIESLSWLYALVLLLLPWLPKPTLPRNGWILISAYVAISLLMLFTYTANYWVMVSRYTTAVALALLPIVVFTLDAIYQRFRERQQRRLFYALSVGILLLYADSLIEKPSHKVYITDAAQWSRTHIQPGAAVVTDYRLQRLRYLSNKGLPTPIVFHRYQPGITRLENYDYAFVRTREGHAQSPLMRQLSAKNIAPVFDIPPIKGKGLRVYRLSRQGGRETSGASQTP